MKIAYTKKRFNTLFFPLLFILMLVAVSHGRNNPIGHRFKHSDKFSWPGCTDAKPSEFRQVKLITYQDHGLKQPAKVCFVKTSQEPNFYFLEKISGRVRYYEDATQKVHEVGDVKHELVTRGKEDGLIGIAFDYDFEKTRWMYLNYSVSGSYRIARYKITPDNKMDISSKQVILDVPKVDGQWHAGGSIDFDAYGNLFISIGDNLYGYYTTKRDKRADHYVSMATANLLGSWLRIHPTEEKQPNGKYYTIPKDNFGEYWAKKFEAQGKASLAADYRNEKLVLPEIWAKGIRNSWGLKVVEPLRGFVASGECGPDHPPHKYYTEEANIANEPKFFGWPIHAGISPTQPFKGSHLASLPGGTVYDSLGPKIGTNTKIKGARTLPPIETAVYSWEYLKNSSPNGKKSRSCGTGAAMYWYDGASKSQRKFPPHFNGKYFVTDHDAEWIRIVTLNKELNKTLSESEFFAPNKAIEYQKPLDVTFGPDGALYVIHWIGEWFKDNPSQHIARIEYTGTCRPAEPVSPFRGCIDHSVPITGCKSSDCCKRNVSTSSIRPNPENLFKIVGDRGALNVSILKNETHSIRIYDTSGRLLLSERGQEAKLYEFSGLRLGLYIIAMEIGNQKLSQKVFVNY